MKTAIIGGGISGLYTGWKLNDEVDIFERKKTIGNDVCSGLFSERILDFIPCKNLIENEIKSAYLHFPKKTVKINFSKKFLVMSHKKLDILTASLAKKSGAKIHLNSNVRTLPKGYDRIIGCDGASSYVRRSLFLKDPNFRLGIQGFVKGKDSSDFVDVWPFRNGFIWKIPRGNQIEYGAMGNLGQTSYIFKGFLKKNKISAKDIKSKVIPQGFIMPYNEKIALLGDAAGLTKPWSGGGVIWSLSAADILVKNFPDFTAYQREMKKFFYPKIVLSKTATIMAYTLGLKIPWVLPYNIHIESDFLL